MARYALLLTLIAACGPVHGDPMELQAPDAGTGAGGALAAAGGAPAGSGGAAGAAMGGSAGAGAGGAPAGSGGAPAGQGGASVDAMPAQPDMRPPTPDMRPPTPDTRPADLAPPVPEYPPCSNNGPLYSVSGCGHLGADYEPVPRWKHGYRCASCFWKKPTDGANYTDRKWGCLVQATNPDTLKPDGFLLCVASCGECAYQ